MFDLDLRVPAFGATSLHKQDKRERERGSLSLAIALQSLADGR